MVYRGAASERSGMDGVDRQQAVLPASWREHVRAVDRALGKHDVEAARRAWESAHLSAVESLSWEGLLAAGEARSDRRRRRRAGGGACGAASVLRRALQHAGRTPSRILRTAEARQSRRSGGRRGGAGLAELQVNGEQRRRMRGRGHRAAGWHSHVAQIDSAAPTGGGLNGARRARRGLRGP
jgi:hypothetical protein